jgi:hypothetical protein
MHRTEGLHHLTALVVVAALAVSLVGCATESPVTPAGAPPANADGVKIGQTTRAEIYAMFGTGYVEEAGPDVIYYSPESLIPKDEDGLPCYRCPADAFGVRITFRDDVVVKYRLVRP